VELLLRKSSLIRRKRGKIIVNVVAAVA